MSDNKKAVQLCIGGRVQGVGFRFYTVKTANKLGLTGYVRNLRDGRVEAYAEGDEETLKEFVDKLKEGPMMASVRKVDQQWQDATSGYSAFDIEY